ncbi:hypothetical protein Nepgr_008601 [Nepenthes gracilis]|uniref:Coiled-coil domain-containing protein 47 n=1 Tax=Nepenthes gracilis TaxID=150966 RepID=A0AAD3S9C2_NEPGR|nr:hypothetical protein Nepgr_008601 [Nepenthes gracilis]
MARRPTTSLWISPLSAIVLPRGSDSLWLALAVFSIFSLLLHHLSLRAACQSTVQPHFEGFGDELDEVDDSLDDPPVQLSDLPPSPSLSQSDSQTHHGPPEHQDDGTHPSDPFPAPSPSRTPRHSEFEYWDEDEFEGLPTDLPPESVEITENTTPSYSESASKPAPPKPPVATTWRSYTVEVVCISFLIAFSINYFTGKRENENLALAWAAKFTTKDSIFEKNFSLVGVGDGEDSPLLLKEGQNVFKFYASGRRYCQGLLATMELKSRHDLIASIYNMIVPCKDEISFEVYMNDDAMDQVVFAIAKKKAAKGMHKDMPDLQRFASLMSPLNSRKWVSEELSVISESKEVASDLITESVLDQVFGERAFEKYREAFNSMHFSDQHSGTHKKKLVFKFTLPKANHMADMTRLVALVPYYIDLVGRYKLSSQARSKTDAARVKAAQESYKELQNARQEAMQKRKAERKKMIEEAEATLSAEAIQKKEAKERARQMKKAMPKMKMTRAH